MKKNLVKLLTIGTLAASVLAGTAVSSPATAQAAGPSQVRPTGVEGAPEFIDFRDIIRRARERRERIARERCERRPGRHRFVRGKCIRVFGRFDGGFGNRDNDNDGDHRGDRRGGFRFGGDGRR